MEKLLRTAIVEPWNLPGVKQVGKAINVVNRVLPVQISIKGIVREIDFRRIDNAKYIVNKLSDEQFINMDVKYFRIFQNTEVSEAILQKIGYENINNIFMRLDIGCTFLQCTVDMFDEKSVAMLAKNLSGPELVMKSQSKSGRFHKTHLVTSFKSAIAYSSIKIVKALIDTLVERPDVLQYCLKNERIPYDIIIHFNRLDVFHYLIGIFGYRDLDIPNEMEDTPLQIAINRQNKECIVTILEKIPHGHIIELHKVVQIKTDVNDVIVCSEYIAWLFDILGDNEIVMQDKFRKTPFHYVCRNRNVQTFNILLYNLGTRALQLQDINGNTALYDACKYCHNSIIMEDRDGIRTRQPPDNAVAIIEILIENLGNDSLSVQNNDGDTPLHIAAVNRHATIIKLLLSRTPIEDRHITNTKGLSPFTIASQMDNDRIRSLFLPMVKGAF